jgi:hypothetical protein
MMIDKSVGRHEVDADHGLIGGVWVGTGCKFATFAAAEAYLRVASGVWDATYPYNTLDVRFIAVPAVGDTITAYGDDTGETFTVEWSDSATTGEQLENDNYAISVSDCGTPAQTASVFASTMSMLYITAWTAVNDRVEVQAETGFTIDISNCSNVAIENEVYSETPVYVSDTPTLSCGTIYVRPGSYDEAHRFTGNVDVVGVGTVSAPNLVLSANGGRAYNIGGQDDLPAFVEVPNDEGGATDTLEGVQPLVGVSKLGVLSFMRPGVGPIVSSSERGGGSLHDHPTLPPRFTNANCVFHLMFDDAVLLLGANAHADVKSALGGLTPIEYMVSKQVPCCLPVIGEKIGQSGQMLPTADIIAYLQACGGEIGSHTMTHSASHPKSFGSSEGYTDPYHIADWETRQARAKIEAEYGYPVSASYHTGSYDPGVALTTIDGLMTRQTFIAHRNSSTFTTAIPKLPMAYRYPFALADKWGGRADNAAWVTRFIQTLGRGNGHYYPVYSHYVVPDGTSIDYGGVGLMDVTFFKALIDALSVEFAAGRMEFHPAWRLPSLYNTNPNRIINGSFEACLGDFTFDELDYTYASPTNPVSFRHGLSIEKSIGTGSTILAISATDHLGETSNVCEMVKTTNTCALTFKLVDVSPGDCYTLRWWQKRTSGAGSITSQLRYKASYISPNSTFTNTSNDVWEQFSYRCAMPTVANYLNVIFRGGDNSTIYIDDVELV